MKLLKQLAENGRTIVCSIHTPSAKIFELFDTVYILNEGQCLFNGFGPHIVEFLENFGLTCPKQHNPADYSKYEIILRLHKKSGFLNICCARSVIEICDPEFGNYTQQMVDWSHKRQLMLKQTSVANDAYIDGGPVYSSTTKKLVKMKKKTDRFRLFHELKILLRRNWLQMLRDKVNEFENFNYYCQKHSMLFVRT